MCTADVSAFLIPEFKIPALPGLFPAWIPPGKVPGAGDGAVGGELLEHKVLGEENKAPWKTSVPTGMNWIFVMLNPEERGKKEENEKEFFWKEGGK